MMENLMIIAIIYIIGVAGVAVAYFLMGIFPGLYRILLRLFDLPEEEDGRASRKKRDHRTAAKGSRHFYA